MVFFHTLAFLGRARALYVTAAALIYVLAPQMASWQVKDTKYNQLTLNLFKGRLDLSMDVLVDVYNPNHLGAYLQNATMNIYRVKPSPSRSKSRKKTLAPIVGEKFGVATCGAHEVPRRGFFDLESHISIVAMPFKEALSFLNEMISHRGIVKVRGIGTANVKAAKQDIVVNLDCVQHVKVMPFPGAITHSHCEYSITNMNLFGDRYTDKIMQLQPYIESALASFDFDYSAASHQREHLKALSDSSSSPTSRSSTPATKRAATTTVATTKTSSSSSGGRGERRSIKLGQVSV